MSLENHPNFHAINFVTEVVSAYFESLRGKANVHNAPSILEEISDFACLIEDKVNASVEDKEQPVEVKEIENNQLPQKPVVPKILVLREDQTLVERAPKDGN